MEDKAPDFCPPRRRRGFEEVALIIPPGFDHFTNRITAVFLNERYLDQVDVMFELLDCAMCMVSFQVPQIHCYDRAGNLRLSMLQRQVWCWE